MKNNSKDILKFVEKNKFTYLEFLCENFDGFPFVCDYSSQILMAYLSQLYDVPSDIVYGCIEGDDEKSHYWIEIGDVKVDFTLCQFAEDNQTILYSNEGENIFFKKGTDYGYKWVYDNLIKDKVPFPFILEDNIWYDKLDYCTEEAIPNVLIDLARKNKNNFYEYLNSTKKLFLEY